MSPLRKDTPVHILGAGSIGLLWAWYLSETGTDIRLIVRHTKHTKQFVTLERYGSQPVILETPSTLSPIHDLIVGTKAFDAVSAINGVSHAFAKNITLYLLQNGMGSQAQVAKAYPNLPIIAGVSTEGALKSAPLHVTHTGSGVTRWGALQIPATCKLDKACLFPARLQQRWENNIEPALWQKLIINACINPLTVKYDCLNGKLAELHDAQIDINTLISESEALLSCMGRQNYIDNIRSQVQDVIRKTANNSSSMRQDVIQHRLTEIDYINGFIANMAANLGIDTPLNTSLADFIRQKTPQ